MFDHRAKFNMAEDIRLENDEVKNEIPIFSEASGCQLCLKKLSKYTCPRCNVKYCSLECYRSRKHIQCSETFYKKCVMDSLQGDAVDSHEKRKMVEILKRFEKEETEESLGDDGLISGGDLEERLEGLNLDNDTEKIWEKLTAHEKREFQRAVDDGYIGSLVDTWVPWWIIRDSSPDDPIKNEISGSHTLPKLLKNIPELSSLIKSRPASGQTKYNLVNILYSYVYICRYYNGCHHDFLQEAVDRLWKLSAVLCHTVNFSSLEAALRSAFEASQQHKELFNSEEFSLSIIDDILLLLKGCKVDMEIHYVELALSDIHRLLAKAVKCTKNYSKTSIATDENTDSKDHAKSLWLAKKKIVFMLAWFRENQEEFLTLVSFFPVMKEAMALDVKQLQEEKLAIQKSRMQKSGKKLIEEIS